MKLKTFKELDKFGSDLHPTDGPLVAIEDVRNMAIGWLKEFYKDRSEELIKLESDYDIVWPDDLLKHIFNLTEEETKEDDKIQRETKSEKEEMQSKD